MKRSYLEPSNAWRGLAALFAGALLTLLIPSTALAQRVDVVKGSSDAARAKELRVVPIPKQPVAPSRIEVVPRPAGNLQAWVWTDKGTYREGEPIEIRFKVSDDAYVYIFDTDTEGVTRQIFPNYYDQDNYIRGNRTMEIPNRDYALIVSGPSGRERLEILAMTEDTPNYVEYLSFRRDEPYPMRRGGADQLLEGMEYEISVRAKSGKGAATSIAASGRIPPGHSRVDVRPQRVDVVGPVRPFDYARDTSTFTVRSRRHEPEDRRIGQLQIDSDPDNARIYLNGRYMGRTPGRMNLPFGRYEVLLKKDGYMERRLDVQIRNTGGTRIAVQLRKAWWD